MADQNRQAELALLKTLYEQGLLSEANYRAALTGLGVDPETALHRIDTGGGTYVERDVQAGTFVGRDAVAGDKINVAGDLLITDPDRLWRAIRRQAPTPDLHQATKRYLTYVVDRYRYLDLKGMGVSERVPLRLPLDEMYVPLKARIELPEGETWSRENKCEGRMLKLAGRTMPDQDGLALGERLSAQQPVLDLLQHNDALVVLGDPGAGKTTFLKYLALRLATGLGEGLGLSVHLPMLVPLSAYANALAKSEVRLDDFIAQYFHDRGIDLPLDAMLGEALRQGGVLVLLDGLDEVQDLGLRQTVVRRVMDFYTFHRRAGNKFVLTSRVVGYREVRPTGEGLAECTLVDFEADEIEAFVERWTAAIERAARGDTALAAQEAAREREELLDAIQRNPGVRRLAANPLLLTILALMKRQDVTLPERRVELYEQYVRTLLSSWNRARSLGRPSARDLDVIETVRILAPLALWMHQVNPGVGLVKRERLRRKLVTLYEQMQVDDPERASRRFLADVRECAGLLLERGAGQYGFIHLTFEEYLAGVGVARLGQRDLAPVVDLLAAHVGDPAWREVVLLTVGYLGIVQQQEQVAGDVVAVLLERAPGEPGQAETLVGAAVLDAWPGGVTTACKEEVVTTLVQTLGDEQVAASLRVEAGRILARLGDPRFRADAWGLPDEPLLGFVHVPAGPFWMGTRREDVPALKEAFGEIKNYDYAWETPQHEVTLPDYYIARYPVTNAQFQAFVRAGGYRERRYWREAKAAGLWQAGEIRVYQWRRKEDDWQSYQVQSDAPQDFGVPFNLPNHPVVGISWYEALAYCRWLTEQLREWASQRVSESVNGQGRAMSIAGRALWEGVAAERLVVRLPTEAEWEKAARGTDGRRYPWGDEADPARANYYDTGIESTSAVGCFPNGASPYGCAGMAGNVWEWTSSLWGKDWNKPDFKYPYDASDGREALEAKGHRVFRGGAFFNSNLIGRCADRYYGDSITRNGSVGVRVVVSSSPPAL